MENGAPVEDPSPLPLASPLVAGDPDAWPQVFSFHGMTYGLSGARTL